MNTTVTLTSEALRRAADLSDEIKTKQAELDALLAGQVAVDTSGAPRVIHTASGRKFSPEAIEKIRAAQRRRWKAVRKAKAAAAAQTPADPTPATASA